MALTEAADIPLDMRNKKEVAPLMTDKEIFQSMELGDVWWDAELPQLYWYLRKSPTLKIPESWEATISSFEQALLQESRLRIKSPPLVLCNIYTSAGFRCI